MSSPSEPRIPKTRAEWLDLAISARAVRVDYDALAQLASVSRATAIDVTDGTTRQDSKAAVRIAHALHEVAHGRRP